MNFNVQIDEKLYTFIEYYPGKIISINLYPFDGTFKIIKDVLIIKWTNDIEHYFINKKNIYYQYYFNKFDINYYKSQLNDTINWINYFEHWLIYGRTNNISYFNYWNDIKIFYINLDFRTDRNNHINLQFIQNDINNFERFNALIYNLCDLPENFNIAKLWNINGKYPNINIKNDTSYICGVYGCYKSHLTILENFYENKTLKYLIILEDDYYIENNFKHKINDCLLFMDKNNIIYNMLYLSIALFEQNEKTFIKINDNLLKIKNSYGSTTHAILYNIETVKNVIDYLKTNEIIELDKMYVNINNRYCINPGLGYQISDKSDIGSYRENILIDDNKVVNYGKLNKNYECNNDYEYVIYVHEIETLLFEKILLILQNIFITVKNPVYDKKHIIFGNYNICDNDIIFSNNIITHKKYVVDDFHKYNDISNVYYLSKGYEESILYSLNLINFFKINGMNENIINLVHLNYSKKRYELFFKFNRYKNINIIPAIKYEPLFLGCMLSNKLIIKNAIDKNLNYVQICEDDVIVNDYDIIKYSIQYLNKYEKWNLLSCFNVNIDESYVITKIINLDDKYKLLKLNKWCSTVFNIYHNSSYLNFLKYDENNINLNEYDENGNLKNTIDRAIQFDDIYIIYPYPVEIINVESDIWKNGDIYENYLKMLKNSIDIIERLLQN